MAVSVEEVSSSLVREYLNRKGLRRTIACMDEEHPRTAASVNNRSHLRQILSIEGLYRMNKVQNSPLKTLLEIIVMYHIKKPKNERINSNESVFVKDNPPGATPNVMNDRKTADRATTAVINKHIKSRPALEDGWGSQPTDVPLSTETLRPSTNSATSCRSNDSEDQEFQPVTASLQDNENFSGGEPERKNSSARNTQKSRTNRIRCDLMTGPILNTLQDTSKKRHNRRLGVSQPRHDEEEHNKHGLFVTSFHLKPLENNLMEMSSPDHTTGQKCWSVPEGIQRENSSARLEQDKLTTKIGKSLPFTNMTDLDVSEMVLDDIDNEDNLQELSEVSCQRTRAEHGCAGYPMDQHMAMNLKSLLLGSSLSCFPVEWRNQGITFSETPDLRYGIVQKKGGPCGVLASIQAFVLKKLLFESITNSVTGLQRLRPSNTTRRKCLIGAVAEILWRAGEEKQATVAIYSGRNNFTPTKDFKSDGLLEKVTCFTVDDVTDLQSFLEQHIEQFETGAFGCILLAISAILSRSTEKVREDMDVPTSTLIGAHGYCTQELVNLLLCGRAVANVFDNDMELDSGKGNMMLLKGIKSQCDVGLLSLFEHYNICKEPT
ncbi:probable ubiquitin carboxyl-terminal hydrolase MINDY-4 isoform X2 [Antennarius striatus]|uniref:probable ubiquitin carboxyl-terminal hydrolase MINDY-4 isoform X2 n=1 Tax=Antennarius striatus TaxID=241820 RepID=UPI0035B08EA6